MKDSEAMRRMNLLYIETVVSVVAMYFSRSVFKSKI